ncbi:PucR family transcriptional regulator [Peribacillus sp. SCS-37]|uniref:PucR family transcriptional regulator n=1 Tax=Paraperibacillus esterisolvens TaxID=3115296 RepID=UPI003906C743
MINKLKSIYPGLIIHEAASPFYEDYHYFKTSSDICFGIPKDSAAGGELELLRLMFTSLDPADDSFRLLSGTEQWEHYLSGSSRQLPQSPWKTVRFIFFTLLSKNSERQAAEEAIHTLFDPGSVIIWSSDKNGVLIEPMTSDTLEKSDLEPVLAALESDFYIQFRLFIGSFYPLDSCLAEEYEMEKQCFSIGEKYMPGYRLQGLANTFPFLLASGLVQDKKDWFIERLLGDVIRDEELIETVKTYIECSSNASLAAKKLFMHRNSLQYRIDKFIERTGLDIRSFQDALAAYLLIALSSS